MRTVVLSDLHLGNGGPYDICSGNEELPAFIDFLPPVRLILNGDSFDFLLNDDPVKLDPAQAEVEASEIVKASVTAPSLHALGRMIARGGEVVVRATFF